MLNLDKWVKGFSDLDPDNQLIIAEKILEELELNESTFEADEYDLYASKELSEMFFDLIRDLTDKTQDTVNVGRLRRFKNLSHENQVAVLKEMIDIIDTHLELQDIEEKREICNVEGHQFTRWSHNEWDTLETAYFTDHQVVENCPVHHENWYRTCKRCGYVETSDKEPRSQAQSRRNQEKKERIALLEEELKRLKKVK